MPRYISVTPTFNPISTEEYLRVPMLLAKEYSDEQERVENYKDKLSYIKALMGDEGKNTFKEYDEIMNSISDNPTLSNMREQGKKLREIYREIGSRADIAKEAYDTQKKRAQSDPSLLGSIGSFMDYYNNPEYLPALVSRKDIVTDISGIMGTAMNALPMVSEGVDPTNPSQLMYSRGFSDAQLGGILQDALSANPQSMLGQNIHASLESRGFFNLPPAEQVRALGDMTAAMRTGALQRSYQKNPEYMNKAQRQAYNASAEQMGWKRKDRVNQGLDNPSDSDPRWVDSGSVSTLKTPFGTFTATKGADGKRSGHSFTADQKTSKKGSEGPKLKYHGAMSVSRKPLTAEEQKKKGGAKYSYTVESLASLPEDAGRVPFETMDEETFNSWMNTNKEELEQFFSNKSGSTKELYENMFNYDFYETPNGLIIQPKEQ